MPDKRSALSMHVLETAKSWSLFLKLDLRVRVAGEGALPYKSDTNVRPRFSMYLRGIRWGTNDKNVGLLVIKFPPKLYFFISLDEDLYRSYFLNKFVIFDQKFQNMGSLGDKFLVFDQKLKKKRGPLGNRA